MISNPFCQKPRREPHACRVETWSFQFTFIERGLYSEVGYIGCPVALRWNEIYWHIFFILNIFIGTKSGCQLKQMHFFLFTQNPSRRHLKKKKKSVALIMHGEDLRIVSKYYLNLNLVGWLKHSLVPWKPQCKFKVIYYNSMYKIWLLLLI